jgi:lipopolysaccharide transport system ATP-binding protein
MKTIEVENLSKLYILGDAKANSIRDSISNLVRSREPVKKKDELWALKDISFKVKDGETLGVIGHNGAGKSTLLKILSRITKPTSGIAKIHGRVGSLLEVGTGFHNELTGRENIYLNGAILGMKHSEIDSKFDEIVAFSEVERFLDTPVKFYSSGMYMRLAFSVAAHLEPEILIVDEVLAVGDINFQKKCLGKMDEVSRSGRTVLFVSHNLGSLAQVCKNGLLLDKGEIVKYGTIHEAIGQYLKLNQQEASFKLDEPDDEADIQIVAARIAGEHGNITNEIPHDEPFSLEFDIRLNHRRRGAMFCVALLNKTKERVFTEHKEIDLLIGDGITDASIGFGVPGSLIAPNNYSFLLQIFLPDGEVMQNLFDICPLTILDMGTELAPYKDYGSLQIRGDWRVE